MVSGGGDVSCARVKQSRVCLHTSAPSTRVTASRACMPSDLPTCQHRPDNVSRSPCNCIVPAAYKRLPTPVQAQHKHPAAVCHLQEGQQAAWE